MRRRLATLVATVAWGLCSTAGAQHLDVAVLAPTSGDFSIFGDRVTRQVGVAAADAGGVEFRVFDTAEDPARAWRDAVAAGARVIVGPVGELETRAVLAARDEAGSTVPILVLAPVDGLGDVSASVFRARTTQGDQARAVGALAIHEDGHRTFAVVAADDPTGREATLAFVREVVASGGVVSSIAFWSNDEPRLQHVVDHLVGRRALRLVPPTNPWRSPPRHQRVSTGRGTMPAPDAVFVPDWADMVADVLPFLAFHEWIVDDVAETVALYGTSGWVEAGLAAAGDVAVGARVTRVFAVDDPRPGPGAWADEQVVRFGDEPTEFDAQVHDAAAFVFDVLDEVGTAASADQIADRIANRAHFAGAAGRMHFDDTGGVVRELGWWEIDARGNAWAIGVFTPTSLQ